MIVSILHSPALGHYHFQNLSRQPGALTKLLPSLDSAALAISIGHAPGYRCNVDGSSPGGRGTKHAQTMLDCAGKGACDEHALGRVVVDERPCSQSVISG